MSSNFTLAHFANNEELLQKICDEASVKFNINLTLSTQGLPANPSPNRDLYRTNVKLFYPKSSNLVNDLVEFLQTVLTLVDRHPYQRKNDRVIYFNDRVIFRLD